MIRIVHLLPILLVACATGCGCLLGGGGDTARADRLNYTHKEFGVGIGGPGWWLLKQLGARFIQDEEPVAALAIRGVKGVQVSKYILDAPSKSHRDEIFDLYAELMDRRGWRLIVRVGEDDSASCVYAQYDEDRFRGVFVVAIEGSEMHVVKVVGDFRPEAFAELNAQLGHGIRLPVVK
ncbi:MAG: DUF4252 domain-containing protein [Candidatus Poribacteria bacterium]|nr:DUF4252 domain-containing protein [Candidatus Poribacteria bacterium]